jgi:(p)ppGpp synthase/HD superfamily hydrolase
LRQFRDFPVCPFFEQARPGKCSDGGFDVLRINADISNMNNSEIFQKAWVFASRKHNGQLYPGTERLPYLTHIGAVLLELLPALKADSQLDAELAICCAMLHDTVEDTDTTLDEISEAFGEAVAAGVSALTKTKALKGEAATRDSLERIRRQPHEVWAVKLADRSANLQTPPDHWDKTKRLSYAKEGKLILDALGDASPVLSTVLNGRINRWEAENI